MQPVIDAPDRFRRRQFGLAALLEFITLCAVLSALSGHLGLATSAFLMVTGLALGAGLGPLALLALMAASLASDWPCDSVHRADSVSRQLIFILVAFVLCGWYLLRRNGFSAVVEFLQNPPVLQRREPTETTLKRYLDADRPRTINRPERAQLPPAKPGIG